MKFIGTGAHLKLATLIRNQEITDKSIIAVYDKDGKFLARGAWYEDKILEYNERYGRAYRAGTGRTVTFQLCY